ncbi:MAG: hypothetical protein H6Q06_1651 [Acidobacteria bacterium]|nr:hypothetical protein [Acidobacteriota bacterium]
MTRSTVGLQVNRVVLITLLCACVASTLVPLAQAVGAEKSASGELLRVDSDAKTFTIKSDEGKEMDFYYSDQTVVVGGEKGVQGLSSKTGSKLEVFYTEAEGKFQAVRIEIKS